MQGNVRVLAVALVLTITENTQNNATLSINFVSGFARDVIRNMSPIEYSAADLTSRNEFGRLKRKQEKSKGLHCCKPLILLAPRDGLEPPTQ